MLFKRHKEKELKMIWKLEKNGRESYLVGTAHFIPYCFKTSLYQCLKKARTVMFEGPLDEDAMARVVDSGLDRENNNHIFRELDKHTIDGITRELAPKCLNTNTMFFLKLCKIGMENEVYEMVKGMKPWLAFFTIWSAYLKKNGWKYSVDLEGYHIASELGKKIVFLETIEEQIRVLENLSRDRIIRFLKCFDEWPELAREYSKSYLSGDLKKLKTKGLRFPSRHHSVINSRDEIFYERMQPYLDKGDAVVFVGAPHAQGISKFLLDDRYHVSGPNFY